MGRALSAAHKAKISASLKAYYRAHGHAPGSSKSRASAALASHDHLHHLAVRNASAVNYKRALVDHGRRFSPAERAHARHIAGTRLR